MLTRRQKESAVYQRIPVEDVHGAGAEDAGHAIHLVLAECGQQEGSRVVVAVTALVFHLDVVGIDLVPG